MATYLLTGPEPQPDGPIVLKPGDIYERAGEYPFSTVIKILDVEYENGIGNITDGEILYVNESALPREEWMRRFWPD